MNFINSLIDSSLIRLNICLSNLFEKIVLLFIDHYLSQQFPDLRP